MRYLVTGGCGFIGSHLVEALCAAGAEVVVLDNLSSGHLENLASVKNQTQFVEGDIRDPEICLRAAEGCDGIFHEAALVSVPDSVNRPRDNHDINITGTLNVLEAARQQKVRRVVFASSAAVYGDNPDLPKREEMLPEPQSPYALAKLTGEGYLKTFADCYGLEAVALRYFNVFGPRQDPSSMYSGVISIFAERVKAGLPITFYGDGEQTRDFVNVNDVVQANLAAMIASASSGGVARFNVFNVAAGRQTSLLQLLDTLEKISKTQVPRQFEAVRPGDIKHSLADISKAEKLLGYAPQVNLYDGLADLITNNQ